MNKMKQKNKHQNKEQFLHYLLSGVNYHSLETGILQLETILVAKRNSFNATTVPIRVLKKCIMILAKQNNLTSIQLTNEGVLGTEHELDVASLLLHKSIKYN